MFNKRFRKINIFYVISLVWFLLERTYQQFSNNRLNPYIRSNEYLHAHVRLVFISTMHRVNIERKCPYKEKLKGVWVSPLYFDNNDVTYK